MNTISAIHEMCIKRNKEIDTAILGEIKQIAIENGIKTEVVLNDKAIIKALEKQKSKKPIEYLTNSYCCPCCNDVLNKYSCYCSNCGQALDWGDTE